MAFATFVLLAMATPVAAEPAGRWLGQDGHDLVGFGGGAKPVANGYQDIHAVLTGIPLRREIVFAELGGLGGDGWMYRGKPDAPPMAVVRKPGSSKADLFFEPSHPEDGRPFNLKLRFDDGSNAELWIQGGKADSDLRMPEAALKVAWLGQDGQDRVGPGPAVGPDGVQDIHLVLERLREGQEARDVAITSTGGAEWQIGTNPKGLDSAELIRRPDEPGKADLFLDGSRLGPGRLLVVTITYGDGKHDRAKVVAGRFDPGLRMPRVTAPGFADLKVSARWVGQDAATGDVKVALEGLSGLPPVGAAALSDSVRETWAFRENDRVPFEPEPWCRPLFFRQDGPRAELAFPPSRDETGTTMTLRLTLRDGRSTVVRFPGGACDPGRYGPSPAATGTDARPGDDLHGLVDRFGAVRLTKGDYRLSRPLVLNRPVSIVGVPGARLIFDQPQGDPPWTAAIKIHAGRTSLEGFTVRFAGPVRWAQGIDYGAAVIASTDNLDRGHSEVKVGLSISRMDVEGPPPSSPDEEAVRLIRLQTAANGAIERNILRGGTIVLKDGPWRVVGNEHRGAMPGSYSFSVLATFRTHDLLVKDNRIRAEAGSGKVWRFLGMTVGGAGDVVEGNTVEGVGPKDTDTGPNRNAPEIVITESYRLHFEGKPAAVSEDGRVLVIPRPQADRAASGDVVAVLTGPGAGRWTRIAHAINDRTYLLDEPLPKGEPVVSIATGFVNETFRRNTIDARGGAVATQLVLVGNHFGLKVLENRILGGGEAFRILSVPTESPGPWGWTHAPLLGARIEGNTIEDARFADLGVEHNDHIKSSRGRLYLTATVLDNTFLWTAPFLSTRTRKEDWPSGLRIGDPGAIDPGELVVSERGTRAEVPAGARPIAPVRVETGQVNGRPILGGRAHAPGGRAAADRSTRALRE